MQPKTIKVVNPSGYTRSDYVEIELQPPRSVGRPPQMVGAPENPLVIPREQDERNLRLIRIVPNKPESEIAFQIDRVFGENSSRRILTFMSDDTPPGDPDYRSTATCATYRLEEGTPTVFGLPTTNNLGIEFYADGAASSNVASSTAHTVKLLNGRTEVAFRLLPMIGAAKSDDLAGGMASVCLHDAPAWRLDNFLSPFSESPEKRWGQVTQIVFFPLPWDLRWFQGVDLRGGRYEVVWSKAGPIRSVVTLRSEPMFIRYKGGPLFRPDERFHRPSASKIESPHSPDEVVLQCRLYRVLSLYPNKPYYTENLVVLADRTDGDDQDISLSFRPYFHSVLNHSDVAETKLARFEHIPDYLAFWKKLGEMHYGYGFASDAHVRGLMIDGNRLSWRLALSHHHRCIHYFMYPGWAFGRYDPFHEIGHYGWYERLLKPLEAVPLASRYPAPVPEQRGAS